MDSPKVEIQNGKAGFGGNRNRLSAPDSAPRWRGAHRRRFVLGSNHKVPACRSGVKSLEGLQDTNTIMAKDIHVVPHDDSWAWRREGASRVSGTADTQADAERTARRAAQRDGVELIVHRPDGRIRDKDSHGRDPYPPKG